MASKTLSSVLTKLSSFSTVRFLQVLSAFLFCIVLVGAQAKDSSTLIETMRTVAQKDLDSKVELSAELIDEFKSASTVKVIPPFDGGVDDLPWRELSGYVLAADKGLETWGFFARYDAGLAGLIQQKEVLDFQSCRVPKNSLFLVRSRILNELTCNLEYSVIKKYGALWTLIKS